MPDERPDIGSWHKLPKADVQQLMDRLVELGYQLVGPQVRDDAIVFAPLASANDLPRGIVDDQDGGHYRLRRDETAGWFDFVVGPQSLKSFVLPPRERLISLSASESGWRTSQHWPQPEATAVIGVRGCDLHALAIMDQVFLGGPYQDERYRRRRESLFLIGINCRRAADTCFCHSMGTGPALSTGYDLGLTELDQEFLLQVGTVRGGEVVGPLSLEAASPDRIAQARAMSEKLERSLNERASHASGAGRGRWLDTNGIRDTLLSQLDHPRWQQVAQRCLACANCTMVCPTCFCTTVEEVSDLSGEQVTRERRWESCFTADHSYTAGGTVHPTTQSRYRQWLTHKLASWHDQFGSSGCVGCGRCIAWCPVGIDLTEEVASIRQEVVHHA